MTTNDIELFTAKVHKEVTHLSHIVSWVVCAAVCQNDIALRVVFSTMKGYFVNRETWLGRSQ